MLICYNEIGEYMKYNIVNIKNDNYFVAKSNKGITFIGSRNGNYEEIKNFFSNEELVISDEFKQLEIELQEYFDNKRKSFDVELDLIGTSFQKKVWNQVMMIKYGCTKSYSDIALELGNINKTRAVSNAIAKNPILIIVPCHRVIGKKGELRGYRGGLEMKKDLLDHERN